MFVTQGFRILDNIIIYYYALCIEKFSPIINGRFGKVDCIGVAPAQLSLS